MFEARLLQGNLLKKVSAVTSSSFPYSGSTRACRDGSAVDAASVYFVDSRLREGRMEEEEKGNGGGRRHDLDVRRRIRAPLPPATYITLVSAMTSFRLTFSLRPRPSPSPSANSFQVLDSIKDIITEGNFDCSPNGLSLQAMDSSHVSLIDILLESEGFEHYRCDRNIPMGLNITNLVKMLKCAGSDDIVTIKCEDKPDNVTFLFESKDNDKISDFEMKTMTIDDEHLLVPDQTYTAVVKMPSAEFQRLCRDMSAIGDTVHISVTKEGVRFSTTGDIGTANITVRPNPSADLKDEERTEVQITEPVSASFALRYLNSFTKATPLSPTVTLGMVPNLPVVVEYKIADMGHVRYYLAPKIEDEENGGAIEA